MCIRDRWHFASQRPCIPSEFPQVIIVAIYPISPDSATVLMWNGSIFNSTFRQNWISLSSLSSFQSSSLSSLYSSIYSSKKSKSSKNSLPLPSVWLYDCIGISPPKPASHSSMMATYFLLIRRNGRRPSWSEFDKAIKAFICSWISSYWSNTVS